MKYRPLTVLCLVAIAFWMWIGNLAVALPVRVPAILTETLYQQYPSASPDGIGKIYMGREIAQVMGHRGAGWLVRSQREREEHPSQIAAALNLQPTDVIADIGAGTGYISFLLSPFVSQGKVLAVDVQPEMLQLLQQLEATQQITNVQPVLGTAKSPNLPEASIDLAIMVDTYHEFEFPREMMQAIVKALKPSGRVALVEYRGENPFIAIKRLHKMTQKQVRLEMAVVGLQWLETNETLPQTTHSDFPKTINSPASIECLLLPPASAIDPLCSQSTQTTHDNRPIVIDRRQHIGHTFLHLSQSRLNICQLQHGIP